MKGILTITTGFAAVTVLAFLWCVIEELGKDYFQGVPR